MPLLHILLIFLFFLTNGLSPEDISAEDFKKNPSTIVKNIRLGGHPEYTRIIIELNKDASYKMSPDFQKKKLGILISNALLAPNVRSQILRDDNIFQIHVRQNGSSVKISLRFKESNTRFIHFSKQNPSQIVVDLKGNPNPLIQGSDKSINKPLKTARNKIKPYIPGIPKNKIKEITSSDSENKLKGGWEEYEKGLNLFQSQQYAEALEVFKSFTSKFIESPYLSHVAYLTAESLYNLAKAEENPHFEEALEAYQLAIRNYPQSHFYDHALFKIASIYEEMQFVLEANTLYLNGIRRDRLSPYNFFREIGLANMMLREGRHDPAYSAFQRILKKTPKNQEARKGIFEIAKWNYENNYYDKALKIYEDAVFRWPEELNENPEVNFYIGQIYFSKNQFAKARKYFFNLINLDPENENAHFSLNRIGDSYLIEGNGQGALSTFNKSRNTNPGSAESQYGMIRLADVGIQYPSLPVRDIIFQVRPFFHPYETYEDVLNNPSSLDVLAEVTLSRGKAYLKELRFLQAFNEFKKLLSLDPSSRYYQSAKNLIYLSLVHLIDQYSQQKGYLPTLYAYSDFVSLNIGKMENIKTLLQIGESYKGVGMNAEALKFFEKVKLKDFNNAFTDRLFLNLGKIHLEENNYNEASLVAKTFTTRYKSSSQIPDAMKIQAAAYKGQNKFNQAINIYNQLLKRGDVKKAEIHYLLAETYFSSRQLKEAAKEYRRTLDSFNSKIRNPPDYIPNAYFKLGIVYHIQKKYEKSLDALKAGRTLFPDHRLRAWGDYLIVENLEQMNQKKQAETELKSLVEVKNSEKVIQKAAETRLKVIDWENRLKELL